MVGKAYFLGESFFFPLALVHGEPHADFVSFTLEKVITWSWFDEYYADDDILYTEKKRGGEGAYYTRISGWFWGFFFFFFLFPEVMIGGGKGGELDELRMRLRLKV